MRSVSSLDDSLESIDSFPKPESLHLRWLEGSRVTTCYGCEEKFRSSMHTPPPPVPYDVVLCRAQIRAYMPKGKVGLRFSLKPENVFFHITRSCVKMKSSDHINSDSISISEGDKKH